MILSVIVGTVLQHPLPEIVLKGPTIIKKSVRIRKGVYRIEDPNNVGAIRIEADGVVVDFQGSRLIGSKTAAMPNSYQGVGILVRSKKNVVIRNAHVQGYFRNVSLESSKWCTVRDSVLGGSHAERILQTGKPVAAFLNLRDPDAWRKMGSGVWLDRCTASKLFKISVQGAQNGILMVGSSKIDVRECNASFNSGWGIGLQQSSDNVIAWNNADYANRPWANGWGGDAAGIVVVNGSNRNVIVGNSLTHGGDGFFLTDRYNGRWKAEANQFEGASNDNIIALNDGSYSSNNAFEATFSKRNFFYKNLALQSRYGFWMGYSSETLLAWNQIANSAVHGIAWEHGRSNWIVSNSLVSSGDTAIACWATAENAQHPSRDWMIAENTISGAKHALHINNTENICLKDNLIDAAEVPEDLRVTAREVDLRRPVPEVFPVLSRLSNQRPKSFRFRRDQGEEMGANTIFAQEFGVGYSPAR